MQGDGNEAVRDKERTDKEQPLSVDPTPGSKDAQLGIRPDKRETLDDQASDENADSSDGDG